MQDAQQVRRGDVLVRLDDTDARIALARAEAELAAAERQVRSLVANDGERSAQVSARAADAARATPQIAAARADLDRAGIDLRRRQELAETGAISDEELTKRATPTTRPAANLQAAQATLAQASAQREAAVGSRSTNQALIGDGNVDTNPDVLAARAAVAQARLDLERTIIRAPVDGIVSRRQVQVGQRVQAGAMLMVIVPVQAAYVDANFKEVELADVRPGQSVTLTSDLYGEDVEFHGRVVGFSGGTGAAFALVPAQNATGNWIKVVQRLPVRIALEPRELAQHPLRVGLSMTADGPHRRVKLTQTRGRPMSITKALGAANEAAPLTGLKLYAAAILIGLGNFLVVLDTTIANVSITRSPATSAFRRPRARG